MKEKDLIPLLQDNKHLTDLITEATKKASDLDKRMRNTILTKVALIGTVHTTRHTNICSSARAWFVTLPLTGNYWIDQAKTAEWSEMQLWSVREEIQAGKRRHSLALCHIAWPLKWLMCTVDMTLVGVCVWTSHSCSWKGTDCTKNTLWTWRRWRKTQTRGTRSWKGKWRPWRTAWRGRRLDSTRCFLPLTWTKLHFVRSLTTSWYLSVSPCFYFASVIYHILFVLCTLSYIK